MSFHVTMHRISSQTTSRAASWRWKITRGSWLRRFPVAQRRVGPQSGALSQRRVFVTSLRPEPSVFMMYTSALPAAPTPGAFAAVIFLPLGENDADCHLPAPAGV